MKAVSLFITLIVCFTISSCCKDNVTPDTSIDIPGEPDIPDEPYVKPSIEEITNIQIDERTMAIVGNNDWLSITASSDIVVAIHKTGYAVSTNKGNSWTEGDFLLDENEKNLSMGYVAYGGGIFCAVGAVTRSSGSRGMAVYTSSDGLNWKYEKMSFGPTKATALIFDGEKFVMTNHNGSNVSRIYTLSEVNETWELKEVSPEGAGSKEITGIAYDGNQYVMTRNYSDPDFGTVGICDKDFNEITWQGSSYLFSKVAYGNSKFVAISGNGGNGATSTNGKSWTTLSVSDIKKAKDIIFAAGKFYIVGEDGVLASSTTGTTWTNLGSGITTDLSSICVMQ